MRLFEAIIDANHRAVAGDASAGLHPADYTDAMPVVALTCIDPRLNAFFPNALALPADQFIWLRNAGNIITGPLSSTMRSLALACALKGGREIAVIGHTDCQIGRTSIMQLLEEFKALGVERSQLPENISEFFGTFGSERQNVIKACDFIRNSPLIGPRIPVHGLLIDVGTGGLEWVVNGYEGLLAHASPGLPGSMAQPAGDPLGMLGNFKDFALGEMKFPEAKIGEVASHIGQEVSQEAGKIGAELEQKVAPTIESLEQVAAQVSQYAQKKWPQPPPLHLKSSPLPPKKSPLPPPLRPGQGFRRNK
jgi:carbonic anhydrase